MCSDIRVRKDYDSMNSELEKKKYIDYCGSFHFTITLPFKKKNSYSDADQKEFRDNHYNFGAMFQWMEPLLLAAFFSCDQDAVGSAKKRIKGSFRVARVGWGNFAGSDMRKKNTGVGRYANVIPYWRKNFDFFDVSNPRPGLLRIGGFEARGDEIAIGISGELVRITFDVLAKGDVKLKIGNLKDDIRGWLSADEKTESTQGEGC